MSSFLFPDEKGQDDMESVILIDQEERSLECYIENSLEIQGTTYLLLMPVDSPVVILGWDDEDINDIQEAFLVEDSDEIEQIFAYARAVLAELNLFLKNTAFTLTVSGDLPDFDEEDLLGLELDAQEDEELEPEELQFLASFYHLEQKYLIYTPIAPLLFLAKKKSDNQLELVSPEDRLMQPILEELLFDHLESD